ncbi:MAG: endonuclease/exonuclease/phosphatase family protein [Salegentibacter sp.]
MQKSFIIAAFFLLANICQLTAQGEKSYKIAGIAFYNVENLFDTENDPFTFDDEKTPTGKDAWNEEKYRQKLANLARVLSEIGRETTGNSPVVIGLCEVENRKVLEDLVSQPQLKDQKYDIIHFDSPDRRGIDVAILYQKSHFTPLNTQSRRLLLYDNNDPDKRDFTRDQLVVTGLLAGEKINFIINHWPSRSGGEEKSRYKRIKAAELNRKIIDSLYSLDPYAKIISMGDFNDDPDSKSLKNILNTKASAPDLKFQELFNPMEKMQKSGMGTLAYRDSWNLFDQMLISESLLKKDFSAFQFYKAGIFNKAYLVTPSGQFRGYPFRSYGYSGYQGGYSDHFPVYLFLIRENEKKSSQPGKN